ncbi:MAG: pyridoxamine 5'-phosphate oxidase [Gammaproteobacteria bacterium]|nr:pyridoxamine 5'-phosphate oxidase [Gammaproteobacteria bacterium]
MHRPPPMLPEHLPADPMPLSDAWLRQAWDEQVQPNPNAMTLATVGADGRPSARIMLCKEIVPDPGYLVFYTNYESRKGQQLAAHAWAAVVFHWDTLGRQVRIEGPVVQSPASESDDYFASRPWQSRIGAWASQQSRPLGSRQGLIGQLHAAAQRFGAPDPLAPPDGDQHPELNIPRPPHWGGNRLWAASVELWVADPFRLHDRARWTRELVPAGAAHFQCRPWQHQRLQP